jgi:hypothetical protein
MELNELPKKFAEMDGKSVAAVTIFAVGLGFGLIELLDQMLKGSEFLDKLVHAGVYINKDEPEPHLWFRLLLGLLLGGILILVVLFFHARLNRKTVNESLQKSNDLLQASCKRSQTCISGMMDAAARIRAQQTPDASHTIKTFETVRILYRIQKDFTTDVVREYRIKAADKPLHFWENSLTPSDHASPVEYLTDIGFRIVDITIPGKSAPVTYLQTENQPRIKRVCVYFLPRLEPTQPARDLQIFCKWPGYFMEMKNTGRETLISRFKSADTTKSVRIELYLQDGSGGNLDCEVVNKMHTHSIRPAQDTQTGWNGYVYEATNIPEGFHEHQLIAHWNSN